MTILKIFLFQISISNILVQQAKQIKIERRKVEESFPNKTNYD